MKLKTIVDEDFVNYQSPVMYIGTARCNGKCCREAGIPLSVCQNDGWRANATIDMADEKIIERYIDNDITSAICFGTGISVEIPEGYFGAIFARSGLATKRGLRPANCVGVIDADYRGELIVALHNDSAQCETIHIGDRIAQLVIMPYLPVHLEEADELSDTVRGTGGFGSTGVSSTSSEYEQLSLFTM